MLVNTFIHIPGIGPTTEEKLWQSNILTWNDKSDLSRAKLSQPKRDDIQVWSDQSYKHLENNNPNFFEDRLPSNQHFRFFPEFRHSCAYLDIETTGLTASAQITTIAIYDGNDIQYFVQGKNLSDFLKQIQKYKVLITYNGRSFDIPFIESYFNTRLPQSQIDLRYILAHLGFKGGLKKCEKALGIDREDLDGVDGYFAVLLWDDYKRTGNSKALETLLAYNIEDVINLEELMVQAYNLHIKKTPFSQSHKIDKPLKPDNPMKADRQTIQAIKRRFY